MMEKYTVDEIKKILQQDVVDEAFVERLKSDERSGVQKLVKQYENKMQKEYDNVCLRFERIAEQLKEGRKNENYNKEES